MKTLTACVLALLLTGAGGGPFEAQAEPSNAETARTSATPVASFEQAQMFYEAGHWAEAYAAYATLADCGHREAARIALQMRQFGPRLYGSAFMAGPRQLQRWRALQVREVGVVAATPCVAQPAEAAQRASDPASSRRTVEPVDAEREIWRHQGVG